MPVNDPNQIDAAKAAALYAFYGNWNKVAREIKRPDGRLYQKKSIIAAVRRRKQSEARK